MDRLWDTTVWFVYTHPPALLIVMILIAACVVYGIYKLVHLVEEDGKEIGAWEAEERAREFRLQVLKAKRSADKRADQVEDPDASSK